MAKTHKKALITGITGQDGSYLAELLLEKGYDVHGLVRRSSSFNRMRIDHLYKDAQQRSDKLTIYHADLTDYGSLAGLIQKIRPDEIYNLGAQSHVKTSFETPEYTANVVALGTLRMLESMKNLAPNARFVQASSSEMFGGVRKIPQDEDTPFYPRSPYAVSKVFGYGIVVNYREAYGLHASNAIMFNHESPRRSENFVTRKITIGIAEILAGKRDKIYLGNLNAKRDWGYAVEYVEAMWRMLQQQQPDDYVLATGETHSVREFLAEAFAIAGIKNWKKYIAFDQIYCRPTDVAILIGNAGKARKKLGWKPKVTFKELVKIMLKADCERLGISLPLK